MSGQEKIFAVDGQHRVEGIKAALQQNSEIQDEKISVMLIGHNNTSEGRERSRRIFSTLNRYVKPVRLGDIIALDEDDLVAITTRELLETYPLFMGSRIKASNSKSIPSSDKSVFTSLMTLYDCHLALLNVYLSTINKRKYTIKQLKDFLKYRPNEEIIDEFKNYLINFWDLMRRNFDEIDCFIEAANEKAAEELRSVVTGGNLFFRPIGLLPFIEAISKIKLSKFDLTYNDVLLRFSSMNRVVSKEPWEMILWNPLTNKMIMRNQSLVKYILINMFDKDILTQRETNEMISKYATVFNISEAEAEKRINNYKF